MPVYEVSVRFEADGERYGSETYLVRAADEEKATAHAFVLSEDSVFHDSRIDFVRDADVDELLDVDADAEVHDAPGASSSARPSEDAAREAIDAHLERELGEVPSYELHPEGDPDGPGQDPDKVGWQFWVLSSDTTSYVHRDLSIEWYGTSWEPGTDEDEEDDLPSPSPA